MACQFDDAAVSRILQAVRRPGQYCGNEINFPLKTSGSLKFLICFPDLYEIGMSHLGIRILYHVLNGHPDIMADLAFAPWTDMEAFLRDGSMSLFGIGSRMAAGEFDIMGFSLQHELQYTNVLAMIELAGLALEADRRADGEPLVIAGGPCAFNPAPMARFMDAFVIGDGETVSVELSAAVLDAREAGLSRRRMLESLAGIDGVYVPVVHESGGGAGRTRRRVEMVLKDEHFPMPPIVPLVPITHDRLSIEIMRGCTRGCRFCSAGMTARPVRQRSVDSVAGLALEGMEKSGWEEVSLVSLSTSDYSDLRGLVARLAGALREKHVSISLPSMRPGTFTEEIAAIVGGLKKTGLTFAPEAGSSRLRRSINKNIEDAELYSTVETAFRNDWESMKLYFMLGLPGEEGADIDAIVSMVRGVEAICRGYGKRKRVTVSLSPFVPRPHTPFQWEAQESAESILAKLSSIKKRLPEGRIKIKWRDPWMSLLEGLLARGGSRLSGCILHAYKSGARFDGWTDAFDFGIWKAALEACGMDIGRQLHARSTETPLPWEHIDAGVTREFLLSETRKAGAGELTADCREGECSGCGACGDRPRAAPMAAGPVEAGRAVAAGRGAAAGNGAGQAKTGAAAPAAAGPNIEEPVVSMRFRVKFAKMDAMRLTSHLDVSRAVQRGMRRAGLPVAYSRGYSPHPRISFGPPLPLGQMGEGEFFDVMLAEAPGAGWVERLNRFLPRGLVIREANLIEKTSPSLMAGVNAATYSIVLWSADKALLLEQVEVLKKEMSAESKLIDFVASDVENGKIEVTATVRLGGTAARSDKILAEELRSGRLVSKVTRKALLSEKDGELYSPSTGFRARVK